MTHKERSKYDLLTLNKTSDQVADNERRMTMKIVDAKREMTDISG